MPYVPERALLVCAASVVERLNALVHVPRLSESPRGASSAGRIEGSSARRWRFGQLGWLQRGSIVRKNDMGSMLDPAFVCRL